ncbi:unnamed protein product [Diatraea saccharalis]|uniref:Ribonuclease P protein subunit p29 n=1 Tax=Diatraea saccharalis TaxID=40085 RepID=A0A9N9WH63_9NEOP|nr:unnamed protein product [Diatraea saccharalis]
MSTEEKTNTESAQAIINFLKSSVPKSEVANVEAELKKDFVLGIKKSKNLKQKARKKKSKNLTRREKKALGFYNISRNSMKYEDLLPMHLMWSDYMFNVLDIEKLSGIPECYSKGWDNFTQSFYRADFHGSMLEVVRSKCPSYVGKKGICIMDTRYTFKMISKDNVITTIPKQSSVFDLYLKTFKVTFFGKLLCVRPAERSTKKLKSYLYPDLN